MADLHEQQYLRITSCFGRRVVERESGKKERERVQIGVPSPAFVHFNEYVRKCCWFDGWIPPPPGIFACENTHLLQQIISSFPLSSAGPFVVP